MANDAVEILADHFLVNKMMAMSIDEYLEKYPCECDPMCECDYE